MQTDKKLAAGFVLFKIFDGVHKALCLYDNTGMGDMPKGRCDNSDLNVFFTAQRECFEETSIIVTRSDIISQDPLLVGDHLVLFCAVTDQLVEIKKNPSSGKYEHAGFEWVDLRTLQKRLPAYLKPAVSWAQVILQQYLILQDEGY